MVEPDATSPVAWTLDPSDPDNIDEVCDEPNCCGDDGHG